MENPKLCHDKSKHSYMLNVFCFPLLCCQCLGVKKGPNRLSVESIVEADGSQLGTWRLRAAATAESLLPQSVHKGSIFKAFSLIDKCRYPCPEELLEGMFFSERNIIILYSAGQTTTGLKRCASCTPACWMPLDRGAWRSGGAAEFPGFYHLNLSSVSLQV